MKDKLKKNRKSYASVLRWLDKQIEYVVTTVGSESTNWVLTRVSGSKILNYRE